MLKKTKKNIVFALALGIIGAFSFGGGSAVSASADAPVDMQSFVMENGAAVRLAADGKGLRFSAEMNSSTYEALEAKHAAYGMLIVPVDYITSGYELTVENVFGANAKYCFQKDTPQEGQKQIINAVSQSLSDKDGDGLYELYGSIVELNSWNIARSFVGQAYVNVDGTYYFAAPYGGDRKNNTRSMYYVSQLAIDQNDGNAATLQSLYIDAFNTYNQTENGDKKYKYTVNHILRKADGSTETVTETKGAVLNSTVTETGNEYVGYILDEEASVTSKKIYANGNTVFDLYYDTYKNVEQGSGNVTLCTAEELGANIFGVTFMARKKEGNVKPNIYFSGNGGADYGNLTIVKDGEQVNDWYAYELDFRSGYDYGSGANPVGLIGDFFVTNQDTADVEFKQIRYITEKTLTSGETWINAARISDEYTAVTYKLKPESTMTGAFYVGNNDVNGATVVGIAQDKLDTMTPDADGFYTFAYNPKELFGGNLKFIHNNYVNVPVTIKDLHFSNDTLVADNKSLTLKTYDEVKDYNVLTFKVKLLQGKITDNALWYGYANDADFNKEKAAAMTPDADGYYTLAYDLTALKNNSGNFSVVNQNTGTDMLIKDVQLLQVDMSVVNGTTGIIASYADAKKCETISFKVKPSGTINGAAYIYGDEKHVVQGLDKAKLDKMTADADGYYTLTFAAIDLYGKDLQFQNGLGCTVYVKDVTFNGEASFVYLADKAEQTLASQEEVKDFSLLSFKVKLVSGAITDNALWYGYANDADFNKEKATAMTPDADGYYTLYYDLSTLKEDTSRAFKVYNQTTGTDMIVKNLSLTNDFTLARKDVTTSLAEYVELKNYETISFKVKPIGNISGTLYYGYENNYDGIDADELAIMTPDVDGFYTVYYELTDLKAASGNFVVYNLIGIDCLIKGIQSENIDFVISRGITKTVATYNEAKAYKTISFKMKPLGKATGSAYWYGVSSKSVGVGAAELATRATDAEGFYTCTIDVVELCGEDLKFQNNLGTKALIKDITLNGVADAWYVKAGVTEEVLTYEQAKDYYSFTFKIKPMSADDWSGATYWYGAENWGAGLGADTALTPDADGCYTQEVIVSQLKGKGLIFQNSSSSDMLLKDFELTKEIYVADGDEITLAEYADVCDYNSLSFKVKLVSGAITDNALWYGYTNDANFDKVKAAAMMPDSDGYYTLYYDLETLKEDAFRTFKVYNQNTGTDMIVKDVTYGTDRYPADGKTICLATYEELQAYGAVVMKVKPNGEWTKGALWYGYKEVPEVGFGYDTTQTPDENGWYTLVYDLTTLKTNQESLKLYNQSTGIVFFVSEFECVDYAISGGVTSIIPYADVQEHKTVSFKMKLVGTRTGDVYWYGINTQFIGGFGDGEISSWIPDENGYYTVVFNVSELQEYDFKMQNDSGTTLLIKDISFADDYYLVNNGIASYSIAIPSAASATEEYAASELQYFIEQMTGATMDIISETSVKAKMDGRVIYIGKTQKSKNALTLADSFGIYLENGNIIIEGQNNRGTLYGVYDFLENQFGVKFLTETYTFVPEIDGVLAISENDVATLSEGYVSEPSVAYRVYLNSPVWLTETDDDIRYATRMRFLSEFIGERTAPSTTNRELLQQTQYDMSWFSNSVVVASHNSIDYAAVGVYALRASIADWESLITYSLDDGGVLASCSINREYALANYASIFDGNGVLDVCYASGVSKDAANLITAKSLIVAGMEYAMDNYAKTEWYMLGQQDREERCTCSVCSEKTTVSGGDFLGSGANKYTDYKYTRSYYVANFVKAVAEQLAADGHTEEKIVMFAYGPTGDAPGQMTYNKANKYYDYSTKITVALPSNVWVQWAPINGDEYFAVSDDSFGLFSQLSDWKTYCLGGANRFMVWTYEAIFNQYYVYAPTMHTWAANIKTFSEFGMNYIFMQSMFTDRVNPDQYMEAYVASKLLWNASTDTDAMNALITEYKNEFIDYFYGATASSYIKEYYTTFDAEYATLYGSIGYLQSNDSGKVWVLGQLPHNDMGAIPAQDFLNELVEKLNAAIAAVNADTTLNQAAKTRYIQHIDRLKLTPRYMLVAYYNIEDSMLYADMQAFGGKQIGEGVAIPA